tara:strand:- start:127 stop:648 length:522 start_codon:yes stop_codon:yes gene_type:complete
MARTFYTDDYKDATVTMYMDHSLRDTAVEMGVSTVTVVSWYKQAVAQGGAQRHNRIGDAFFTLAEKHEACTYYSTHTGDQTVEKTGVSLPSLHKWRKDLGYPNKHYGRNLKSDRSYNDVATLHAKAMTQVNQKKDAYRDKMREFEALIDGLRSDASSIQNKMFDFMQSLNDNE